jgi:predicted secreted protein
VIFVPHCALNQNARAPGAAERPAAVAELVAGLLDRDVGIVQMPCPELLAFGLDRGDVRVASALRTAEGQALCRRLARDQVQQIQAHLAAGHRVLGILGKNGSPSCGVEETWSDGVCPGSGAFIEALRAELWERCVAVAMAGMRDSEPDQALAVVDRWLGSARRRDEGRTILAVLGTVAALIAGSPSAARAQPPATTAIVDFNTLCADCHAGQCSGRLSFDSGAAAARSHIERYRGETHETTIAELFAMLRHVKENCRHYPVVPLRPAVGAWEAGELAPWRNDRAGAYFIPLGTFPAGRRQVVLELDRPVDGSARIDDDRMEEVAEERLCRDATKTVEFDATAEAAYYLHLKAGPATLSRLLFR